LDRLEGTKPVETALRPERHARHRCAATHRRRGRPAYPTTEADASWYDDDDLTDPDGVDADLLVSFLDDL
jgi:hypothetical protein